MSTELARTSRYIFLFARYWMSLQQSYFSPVLFAILLSIRLISKGLKNDEMLDAYKTEIEYVKNQLQVNLSFSLIPLRFF